MLPQSCCLTVCPKQMCLVIVDVAETGEGVLARILTRLRSIGQNFKSRNLPCAPVTNFIDPEIDHECSLLERESMKPCIV